MTSVTIPNTVTRIGDWAFAGCTNLASISIPNSVTSIGEGAFSVCTGLTSILIPESVTSIGGVAFAGCTGLTSVTIPQNVTSIEEGVFGACTNLTNIVVADGNSKYDSRDNCNAIIETASNTLIAACNNSTIPNGVTRIGENAFSGCTGLTSISIPNSVTSIGGYAFAYCSGLTSVVIPYGVTSIGEGSFSACTSLTSVTIPNSVTTIGEKAFAESNSLASVTIPNSVTSIGRDAFWRSCVMPSCNVVYETDGNALSYQGESYSSPSQPVSTSESQKVYSNAYNGNQVVVIDGSELRLRLGPSTSYDTFKWPDGTNCHPNVGDKFKYFGESGDFYKIDFNGNEVWVSKQYSHIESASLLFDLLGKDARNYDFTENDLATLSAKDLTYLRNSVYAKHGYVFKSQELNDYFSQFAWYHPDSSVTDAVLNNTEKTNVEFIKNYQRQNGKTYIPQ